MLIIVVTFILSIKKSLESGKAFFSLKVFSCERIVSKHYTDVCSLILIKHGL